MNKARADAAGPGLEHRRIPPCGTDPLFRIINTLRLLVQVKA